MIIIPDWFLEKNLTANQRYVYGLAEISNEISIVKETEKASQIKVDSDFGSFYFWCPKSILTGNYNHTYEDKAIDAFKNGCARYEKALAFAKSNGLKVRSKMKLANILLAIKKAGLQFEG